MMEAKIGIIAGAGFSFRRILQRGIARWPIRVYTVISPPPAMCGETAAYIPRKPAKDDGRQRGLKFRKGPRWGSFFSGAYPHKLRRPPIRAHTVF